MARFREELGEIDWGDTLGSEHPSDVYENFIEKYISTYNRCFSTKKKVKAVKYNLHKPWFSSGLSKSVRKKNILYQRFLSNPSPENEETFKRYKSKLNHSVRLAKQFYCEKKIEQLKSNLVLVE